MDDLLKKMSTDIEKIRDEQLELIKNSAIHNHLLKEHEARSIALQEQVKLNQIEVNERLKPIEAHVHTVSAVLKIIGALGASISAIYYAYTLLSKIL